MQQYIVGNWKMNGTIEQATTLLSTLKTSLDQSPLPPLPQIIICPSFPYLNLAHSLIMEMPISLGAQDCATSSSFGAYTGDVSPAQLADNGCKYVLIGHSERRKHHQESDTLIQQKILAAVENQLKPIICIGETLEAYENKKTSTVIAKQIQTDIPKSLGIDQFIVAYEPIWAIGTGFMPTLEEIEEALGIISHELSQTFMGGGLIPLLYGGSVTAKNAADLLELPHSNGLLVGGASLNAEEFWKIIATA